MKTLPLNLLLFLLFILTSCEKDWMDQMPENNTALPAGNYTQLKVGNYWIYERYNVDSNGIAIATGESDSCYIEKDTLINGNTYFKMMRPDRFQPATMIPYYWRDSLHYMVDVSGTKIFSYNDFTSVLQSNFLISQPDTICLIERKMSEINWIFNTPAGNFKTLNSKETYYMYPEFSMAGTHRYRSLRFAENTGIVTETLVFFSMVPDYLERRLVRYHLN